MRTRIDLHPIALGPLDTTGRCTTRTHSVSLLAAVCGDDLIATTCMGRGPDWILNLMAEPHADVTTGVSRFPVMAAFPTGDDRAAAAAAFSACRNRVVSTLLRRLVSDTGGTGPQIVVLSPC